MQAGVNLCIGPAESRAHAPLGTITSTVRCRTTVTSDYNFHRRRDVNHIDDIALMAV